MENDTSIAGSVNFDGLIPTVREARDRFARLVEPHRPALWAYCLRLTGSP